MKQAVTAWAALEYQGFNLVSQNKCINVKVLKKDPKTHFKARFLKNQIGYVSARKMCFVFFFQDKSQSLSMSIVSLTNSTVNRERDREGRDDPPFVPTQQFKLHRFCFFGQGRRLWESKLGVTLQVRPVWDASGDPVIRGARRTLRSQWVPLQKKGGEITCVRNFVPSPMGCILDPGGAG